MAEDAIAKARAIALKLSGEPFPRFDVFTEVSCNGHWLPP